MKLNPNKRIGRVLYLVEGDVDEVVILEQLFNKLLNYTTISYDKRYKTVKCLVNPNDKYSKVFIVPMQYSAISKIESSDEYVDSIYSLLSKYGLERDECAKYLLFDRDEGSNSNQTYKHLFGVFKNSFDNDLNINGLLLVSYPCIQSFICECFGDEAQFSTSKMMKNYSKSYQVDKIGKDEMLKAAHLMVKRIINILNVPYFNIDRLDNMEHTNSCVLDYEDEYFKNNNAYMTLSMILISFIDLGIISFD